MADKRNTAPDSDLKRFLRFMVFSLLLLWGYMYMFGPKEDPAQTQGQSTSGVAGQTTGTLESGRDTTPSSQRFADGSTSTTIESHPGDLSEITTGKYKVSVDNVGGVINSWKLMDPGSQSYNPAEHPHGIELVQKIPTETSGVTAQQVWPLEVSFKEQNIRSYEDFNHVKWESLILNEGTKESGTVRLNSPSLRGLRMEKVLEIPKDSYLSNLKITVHNDNNSTVPIVDDSNRGLTLRWGPGLLERDLESKSGDYTYDVAIARNQKEVFVFRPKVDDGSLQKEDVLLWAGVESKFFAALMIPYQNPDETKQSKFFFRTVIPSTHKVDLNKVMDPAHRQRLENYTPPLVAELSTTRFEIGPNQSKTFEFNIYVGPKKHSVLREYSGQIAEQTKTETHLQSAIFSESWSWMRAIYLLLTDTLNWIHRNIVSNYGVAIIILTALVKLLVLPLVMRSIKMQAKSSAEMKRVKPHIDAINLKYKDDPQEKGRQTWKVYQEHGINPLGAMRSCLPVLPQIPIFIGLYRITNDTIDLQGAKFLWIKDLSVADHLVHLGTHIPLVGSHFNLLPIVVAFTQMLSSKIAVKRTLANITDENQRQMQQMMVYLIPVMVMVTMYNFPAGLMVYWMASNTWQIVQTIFTNKILDREEERHLKSGPPPKKQPKPVNPNSFMGKMMKKAEEARKQMEEREKAMKAQQAKNSGKKRR